MYHSHLGFICYLTFIVKYRNIRELHYSQNLEDSTYLVVSNTNSRLRNEKRKNKKNTTVCIWSKKNIDFYNSRLQCTANLLQC